MNQVNKSLLTIASMILSVTCMAQTTSATVVAEDISMMPIAQAAPILPFIATAVGGEISSYTVETVPTESKGVLNINMGSSLIPLSEGMMLTPDLVNSLSFTPNPDFTGNVTFTYSAADENGTQSNIATYLIPVVGAQEVILPINLMSFTGNLANKKAQLYWQTSQENNASYFELQRSTDGKNFETVATATAKGNSANVNYYQQTDDLFFYNFKVVYYRLKMVDTDGKFKYSTVVTLNMDASTKASIKAWPLPFASNLNVEYSSEINETVKISINSINGAAVIRTSTVVKKGSNLINLNQAQSIPAGTYLLTISNGTSSQTIKVIKN